MILLALGSNMGNRNELLRQAVQHLSQKSVKIVKASALYETEPVGVQDQPAFLNAVIQIETIHPPLELLRLCLQTEQELGRVRTLHWGPRVIDIDVICYDQIFINTPELTLPHPYFSERRFVLEPMMDIAPDYEIMPQQRVRDFYDSLTDNSKVQPIVASWL